MSRVIRKSRATSSREAADLLAALFVAEIVKPSRCLWLVSPWISDIPVLSNSAGEFAGLGLAAGRTLRLTDVLLALGREGSTVVIGTTSDASNAIFLQRAESAFRQTGMSHRLVLSIDRDEELHEKAITGDDFAVAGSMNITNNGVFVRQEFIEFRTDEAFVAQSRMDSFERFGGVL